MNDIRTYGVPKGEGKYPEEIIYGIALLYNVINSEIETYLNGHGLSTGKFNILIAIKLHGGPDGISQVDVSKHLIVTPSNMTKMIDKLEADGLVERNALEGDRRVNMIKVTAKGSKLVEKVWEGYIGKINQSVKTLKKEQQKQLAALLTNWFESM